MNTPLFPSHEEIDRRIRAAKKLRSEFVHGLLLSVGRKFSAQTRNVRRYEAAASRGMVLGLACAFPLGLAAFYSPVAQSGASHEQWRADVTVVAIAPDGTWGTATDPFANQAFATAIEDCKRKYDSEIGCGYRSTSVREGWSLVFRCGTENILVAEKELADAQWAAFRKERELRTRYAPEMPACVRTLKVDPQGRVIAPKGDDASSM